MLSVHVDPNEILANAADHPVQKFHGDNRSTFHSYVRDGDVAIPKFRLPDQGVSSKVAYQVIHDELTLDGNPTLNLASFVHTWMPPDAEKLIMENIAKNAVDQDEYPATQAIHGRCISMLANLWNIPKGKKAIGTATAGSSEAIMLGGLALKKRWQEKRKAEGKDYFHPNIIFGANAQVALEKFARYFDVECRLVPVKEEHDFVMHPPDALQYIDENTIGIMVILGSTYNGAFEDVKLMSDLLDKHQEETGLDISIHVDAASGGFFAPFAYPDLKWAFDVPRVASINTSGHKFGLVYAGLGWVIWQDETLLPKEMVFELHYLGSVEYTFSLNFSKPAAPIIAQMFNFLNLGFQGYRDVAFKDLRNARLLARALEGTGYFKVLSPIHRESGKKDVEDHAPELYQRGLPVVSFRLSDKYQEEYPGVKQVWIQNLLRAKGWIVPNYGAPPVEEKTEMLRVVVRETMTHDLIEKLVVDLITVTESLMTTESDGGTLKMMEAIAGRPSKSQEHPDKKHTKPVHHRRQERKQSTFSQTC